MKTELEAQSPAIIRPLRVVLAYDELSAGKLGKELCDRLVRHLGDGCKLQLVPWSLSVLRIPEILQAAATGASGAALIVIAATVAELSVAAVYRIRKLIQHRKNSDSALVMLIKGGPEASPALIHGCALLRQAARDAGMAFFCEMTRPSEWEPSCSLGAIGERACRHRPLLNPIIQRI